MAPACLWTYSWRQLVHGYNDNKVPIKSGGLGKLIELGGYQTWVCINHHFCRDPYFRWVYHETDKVFMPWGTNEKFKLVKSWGALVLALTCFTRDINPIHSYQLHCMTSGMGFSSNKGCNMLLLLSQRHSALDLLRSFCGDCTGKTKRNGNKKR